MRKQEKFRLDMQQKNVGKSSSYIQKGKKRAGLEHFKAQVIPNRNAQQNISAKSCSQKFFEELLTKFDCVVMDDETYCKSDFAEIPGHDFYTSAKLTRSSGEL